MAKLAAKAKKIMKISAWRVAASFALCAACAARLLRA
jgi:hypothetical protein